MHLRNRATDSADTNSVPATPAPAPASSRALRQAPLSRSVLGMPGRVWSMVAWSSLSAGLLVVSIVLPLTHGSEPPVATIICIILLVLAAAVGIVARSRTPGWWLHTTTALWILITCWLLWRSSQLEDGLILFGVVVCAVYVGYWYPRRVVLAYATTWSVATLLVFWVHGQFEHTALMWLTATTISVALAMFLSTLTTYLDQQAIRDPLTGLLNRAGLLDVATTLNAQVVAELSPITAVVLDLDEFKEVNDADGHAAGDAILVAIAGALRRGFRSQDIIARTGGDEFLVILPGTTEADATAAIERIALTSPTCWSFGAALWRPGTSFDDLLADADRAMYAMKQGRTRSPHAEGP